MLGRSCQIADENHFDSKDKALGATLILCWLVDVKRMNTSVAMFLHSLGDSACIGEVDDEGQDGRGARVDNGQLTEEHLQLLISEQNVPIR